MTTFWQRVLAASQLTSGTLWDLISNPKTGEGGVGGTTVVDSVTFTASPTTTMSVDTAPAVVIFAANPTISISEPINLQVQP